MTFPNGGGLGPGASSGGSSALSGEVARFEDYSKINTPMTAGGAFVYNSCITVPVCAGPVTLFYKGEIVITTAGSGSMALSVVELTSGVAQAIDAVFVAGAFTLGTNAKSPGFPMGSVGLGYVTSPRQFGLMAFVFVDATLAASLKAWTTLGNPRTTLFAVSG